MILFLKNLISHTKYTYKVKNFKRTLAYRSEITVIGSGAAGSAAAIRAAQLGMKTVCIEKDKILGGDSLKTGCVPSMSLLCNTKFHMKARSGDFAKRGIQCNEYNVDLAALMKTKAKSVKALTERAENLFLKNQIQLAKGIASFKTPNEIQIDDTAIVRTHHTIIATGSQVVPLPGVNFDQKYILSSTEALSLLEIPEKLTVIGAGMIGLELGTAWQNLGSKVTILETLPTIGGTSGMDLEISEILLSELSRQGIEIRTNSNVLSVTKNNHKVIVQVENTMSKDKMDFESDKVLIAVGRKPYIEDLRLDKVGIEINEKGNIKVNEKFQTSVSNIYAVGDCIEGPMLVHRAESEAVAVVENIKGIKRIIKRDSIPHVLYTDPEVAWVGRNEEQLKNDGIEYNVGRFPFFANSRSRCYNALVGHVKVLSDKKTGKLLGTHIIGDMAGEIINEAAMAHEHDMTANDVFITYHAYPTHSQAFREATMSASFGTSLNY